MKYNREKAVRYALDYALKRNSKFYDFSLIGGDCTNFISQCLYAGSGKMDYSNRGWFYNSLSDRSPSWTGVDELYDYLISNKNGIINGSLCNLDELELGDIIQLKQGDFYNHTLIITKINYPLLSLKDIYVCCHSIDRLNANLSIYPFREIRFIKIS